MLSVCVGVRLLQSSAWDEGLTMADLLPVWALWVAGVGAAFSTRLPDPAFNRTNPWERIGVSTDAAKTAPTYVCVDVDGA